MPLPRCSLDGQPVNQDSEGAYPLDLHHLCRGQGSRKSNKYPTEARQSGIKRA
jgi:hypothetical protein